MTNRALPSAADRLNSSCFCITLDRDALYAAMEREACDLDFSSHYLRAPADGDHLFRLMTTTHSNR